MKKSTFIFKLFTVVTCVLMSFTTEAQMVQLHNTFGQYQVRADACGTNGNSCTITIEKPVGATTIFKAYIYFSSTAGQPDPGPNALTVSGGGLPGGVVPITNLTQHASGATTMYTRYEDVTALFGPGLNAAPAGGTTTYTVSEAVPNRIDGDGIIVIWNNPTTTTNAVHLSLGSRTTATLITDSMNTAPINTGQPGFYAIMGMGFAFSTATGSQINTVSVNGSVLDINAGGLDDGAQIANGCLITLGGYQDSPTANSDELYDISGVIANGSTQIKYDVIMTQNHTSDWLNAVYFEIMGVTSSTSDTTYTICYGDSMFLEGAWQTTAGMYYDTLVNHLNMDSVVTSTLVISTPINSPGVVTDVTCSGGSDGEITVTPTGGIPPYSYVWSMPGPGNSPTATNLAAGQYSVTITDSLGCTKDTTFTVNEPAPISLGSFDADILSGCAPLTVQFTNTMVPGSFTSFVFDFGNGSTSTISPDVTTYNTPGTYDVSISVIDTAGCQGYHMEQAFITVFANPVANFTYNPAKPTMFDPTVDFQDLSQSNIVSWNWDFNNLGNSNDQHPTHVFPQDTGTYMVELWVEDNNGCRDTTVQSVRVFGQHAVYVPNAFSPDEDGLNDGFFPNGFGIVNENYSFMIFDRWGGLVFESHKPYQPWYGDYQGEIVPNGVFVWKLHYQDVDGLEHDRTGHVNVFK